MSSGAGGLAPLVLATRNPGKLAEFVRLLAGHPWELVDLATIGWRDELDEPGPGYVENAAAKAVAVHRVTGLSALGDDSGIEVLALGGWPGAASARWQAGTDADRLSGLLARVAERCPTDRRARYVAALALFRAGAAEPVVVTGTCSGLLVEPRGLGGFGYDPAFLSEALGRTFGEAAPSEKDTVSHRARAVAQLAAMGVLTPRS